MFEGIYAKIDGDMVPLCDIPTSVYVHILGIMSNLIQDYQIAYMKSVNPEENKLEIN